MGTLVAAETEAVEVAARMIMIAATSMAAHGANPAIRTAAHHARQATCAIRATARRAPPTAIRASPLVRGRAMFATLGT